MAIAFDANLGTVTNSATLTTSAAAASGSRVIMFVYWYGTQTVTGASGGSLTWVVDHQFRGSGGGDQNIGIVSAHAASGMASSTVITPTFSATPSFGPGMAAASFTGLVTGASGYLDTTSTGVDDFNATWATNNLVTTTADCLLVALSVQNPSGAANANTATAPSTEIHEWVGEGTQELASEYRIVSSASTYTLAGAWAGSGVTFQHNIAAAYKMAAAGGSFGKATVGANRIAVTKDYDVASKFTLASDKTIYKLSIHLDGSGPGTGNQVMKAAIWDDSAGTPGVLQATSNEVTIIDGQAGAWVDFTLPSPVALVAGSYWLGYIAGDNTNTAQYGQDDVANNRKYKARSYALGPEATFGSVDGTDQFQIDVNASWAAVETQSYYAYRRRTR